MNGSIRTREGFGVSSITTSSSCGTTSSATDTGDSKHLAAYILCVIYRWVMRLCVYMSVQCTFEMK